MLYAPIINYLSPKEDFKIQNRYSRIATKLSRTTNFSKINIQRLFQLYYLLTVKEHRIMDKLYFIEFMSKYLAFKKTNAIEAMFKLYCRRKETYMIAEKFVELVALLLQGSLVDKIAFCFSVYKEIADSTHRQIRREDILKITRNYNECCGYTTNMENINKKFVAEILAEMDKDKDRMISFKDYQKSVNEDVSRLQFLGSVIPSPENVEAFMKMCMNRSYKNYIERDWIIKKKNSEVSERNLTKQHIVKLMDLISGRKNA